MSSAYEHDMKRVQSQLAFAGDSTTRLSNPQFTTLNMAPYHRPQSQAFGFRHGSLQRDPSRKTVRASEEVLSITGLKTMSALGPSMQKN